MFSLSKIVSLNMFDYYFFNNLFKFFIVVKLFALTITKNRANLNESTKKSV